MDKKETTENEIFALASDIVCNTSQSVFLTGKAGTGKTTFLHHIKQHSDKNTIVAAPTGVAAINAGGVTLHSLLQLPFEPFIPTLEGHKKLDYHFKLRKSKIEMLRELELLIIDEVSMLRADMLDAIDYMLQRYRNDRRPFGGVQMLFIGDMFQLPPVVQSREWELLKNYYPSPFFFHARALDNNMPLYIELKKVYRQSDTQFIGLLNNIRNNCATASDLELLNRRYKPSFVPTDGDSYVTLCTHNYKADKINGERLEALRGECFTFQARVRGDFAENAYPTESDLKIKVGAQVMFIKNDVGESRRYYNGKLATVSRVSSDNISVVFANGDEMKLDPETWANVRYVLNEDSGNIEEEELGSFTQYPIRLAWAITIHKSQGLTFDKVVIDAGQAFAAGQVYVALSRCTTLEGIVLHSPIKPENIQTDIGAIAFSKLENSSEYLSDVLHSQKPQYCAQRLKKVFDWSPIIHCLQSFSSLVAEKKIPAQENVLEMASAILDRAEQQQGIARNFGKELDQIFSAQLLDLERLENRVQKAALYFDQDMREYIIKPFALHLQSLKKASKVKAYLKQANELLDSLQQITSKLRHIHYGNIDLTANVVFPKELIIEEQVEEEILGKKSQKPRKGDSVRVTLEMFREGKSIAEIATERNLAHATIEKHLLGFVASGEVDVHALVSVSRVNYIMAVLDKNSEITSLSEIKGLLPDDYTYMELTAVINHVRFLSKK